jgi:hypothetical protein
MMQLNKSPKPFSLFAEKRMMGKILQLVVQVAMTLERWMA